MNSRYSNIKKTEDLNIRYKDCDTSGKVSSVKKTSAKVDKVKPWALKNNSGDSQFN